MTEEAAPLRRARNRKGEGALLRDEILSAASDLFVVLGGEENVTIRAVAAAAGVSPPSVYLHFADKGELIFAVCQALFAELDESIEAAVAGVADPFEALRARAKAYVRFGVEHPEHYRVLFMRKPDDVPPDFDPEKLKESAAFGHLYANIEAMLATGRLRDGLVPHALAIEVWAFVHGYTSLVISHPDFDWPDPDVMVDEHCAHLLGGLLR